MSQTTITTPDASKIAKRLINHWRHKFTISEQETAFVIHMTGADVSLVPQVDTLDVIITTNADSNDPERPFDEGRLREVIANHIDRMANQSFEYQWTDVS